MRKLVVVVTAAIVIIIGMAVAIPRSATKRTNVLVNERQRPTSNVDLPGTIDGAKNPEKIPDHVAYLAMFRMLSNRRTEAEQNSVRTYLRGVVGLGKQRNCQGCRPSAGTGDADIENFLVAAEEFYQRVSVLDQLAAEIKNNSWPNPPPEVMDQLARLQKQKDAMVSDVAASLQLRLSAAGYDRLRQHVNEHVKLNIKMTPSPTTPPNGIGWQHNGHIN